MSLLEQLRAALLPEYDVERELARGGMGIVFLARDVALECSVAVKVLRPELATADAAERFVREARTARNLHHPHIVTVHFAGERQGFYFYVMDYIEDPTLAQRLERGPLATSAVVKLGRDLLDALDHAHQRQVIHRDIKPSNVFLSQNGALLGDFGIAKSDSTSPGISSPRRTTPGLVVGTHGYMPPEQAIGGTVTPRTDLYAVAMVLYEALTGRRWPVFESETASWSGVPRAIARVLRRALEFDPMRRWPDAAAFRHALWRTRVQTYRWRTASLTALGLVVGGIVMRVLGPGDGDAGPRPADLALVPFKTAGDVDPKLGWSVPRLAALNLQAFPLLAVVDPRTSFNWWEAHGSRTGGGAALAVRGLDARHLVQGEIFGRGDSIEVRVVMLDPAGVVEHAAVVRGRPAGPDSIANAVALDLVLTLQPGIAGVFRGSSDLSARSVPALGRFLEGEDAFARDDWLLAEQRYQDALALDSTFALAQWRLANVQRWRRTRVRVDLHRLYAQQRHYLTERDRLLLAAQLAPTSARRLALYDTVLAHPPPDAYAALLYGSELLSRGALAGIALDSALVVLQRAVRLDSSLAPGYDHLAWAAIRLGRRDVAAAALAALHRLPVPRAAMDLDFTALLDLTFRSRFGPTGAPSDSVPFKTLADLARGLRFGLTFDVPEAQVAFGAALVRAPGAGRELQANGHEAQGVALVALGRVHAALAHFDSAAALFDRPEARLEAAQWRVLLGPLGLDAVGTAERQRGAAALEQWVADPRLGGRAVWALALAADARGDTEATARWHGRLARRPPVDSGAARLARLVHAVRLARRGGYGEALLLTAPLLRYDSAGRGGDPFARSVLHMRRAEWFERLGDSVAAEHEWLWHDNADAVDWPVGVAQAGDVDWALGTYARLRRGELALARGARPEGCAVVTRVAELWAQADATLAALRRAADRLVAGCR